MAQVQVSHPSLQQLRVGRQPAAELEGLTQSIESHGAPAVIAGLGALLESLIQLLGRLIGDDMVERLVGHNTPHDMDDDEDMK